jgi:hypothetical protein
MKPFDLQKALAGEPVVTKQGDKIIQLHYFSNLGSEFKVIVHKEHSFSIDTYKINGMYGERESQLDLVMEYQERWANIYWDDISLKAYIGDIIYSTEEEAKENGKGANYRTTIKLK